MISFDLEGEYYRTGAWKNLVSKLVNSWLVEAFYLQSELLAYYWNALASQPLYNLQPKYFGTVFLHSLY